MAKNYGHSECLICNSKFKKKIHNQSICGNRECFLERKKRNKKLPHNAEKIKEYSKIYYHENKDKCLLNSKKWIKDKGDYNPPSKINYREYYHKTKNTDKGKARISKGISKIKDKNIETASNAIQSSVHYSLWSNDEDLKLLSMIGNGIRHSDIAVKLNRSLYAVRSRITYIKGLK